MMSTVLPSSTPDKGTPNAQAVLDAREWQHPVKTERYRIAYICPVRSRDITVCTYDNAALKLNQQDYMCALQSLQAALQKATHRKLYLVQDYAN